MALSRLVVNWKKFMPNTVSSADTLHAGMQIMTFPDCNFSACSHLIFLEKTFFHTDFASAQNSLPIFPQSLCPLGRLQRRTSWLWSSLSFTITHDILLSLELHRKCTQRTGQKYSLLLQSDSSSHRAKVIKKGPNQSPGCLLLLRILTPVSHETSLSHASL